jgi:hypothetical protein
VFINHKLMNPIKRIDFREGDEIVLDLPGAEVTGVLQENMER